jgi:hypothetical protein
MRLRFLVTSAFVVAAMAALLPASGLGSSAAPGRAAAWLPAGLTHAIHARLGAGTIGSGAPSGAQAGPANFGFSVALSADGTTALVGAPHVRHDVGAAYIFHASDAGSWSSSATPVAALTHPTSSTGHVGFDVALSADGTTAFVGAPGSLGQSSSAGAIYVFQASAEDAWASSSTPTATLTASGALLLGYVLATSPDGTTLVAGAPFADAQAGGGYVFHVPSEGAWASTSTPTATLSNAGESQNDSAVGLSVAISGDGTTVLLSDAVNPSGGGAYVYHVAAEDAWTSLPTPTAILSDASSTAGDYLGVGLALSGDGTVAFLGAPSLGDNSHYPGLGYVDVFHASTEAAWASTSTPTATLTTAGSSPGDELGFTVKVSSDGTTALVNAPNPYAKRGAAYASYIFQVSGEGAWASSSAPTATLTGSHGRTGDSYDVPRDGGALSADGATALVAAPGSRFGTGATDVFHVSDAASWASSSTPTAVLTDSALVDCVVPKLKGLKVAAAKAALTARSCRLGKVSRLHAKGKRGRVVSQNRIPGARLPAGAKVAVKIKK